MNTVDLLVQTHESILLLLNAVESQILIARYTRDGYIDASFGEKGFVLMGDETEGFRAGALALQQDQKIICAATMNDLKDTSMAVVFAGMRADTGRVSEKVIASYVHVKKNPEVEGYVGKSCGENKPAGLAYYNGEIWLFQSVWNGSGQYNDVQYQTYDIANDAWSNCSSLRINGSIRSCLVILYG